MNITKTISGLVGVMALTLVTAGASMAQIPFTYSATFSPNPVISSGGPLNFIGINDGFNIVPQTTPTTIDLAEFFEKSNTTAPPLNTIMAAPFSDAVTITTAAGSITHNITGTLTASFDAVQSFPPVSLSITAPGSAVYDFTGTGGGIITVSFLAFNPPGSQSEGRLGSMSAIVTSTTPSTPEPATVVPFALGGLGLLGLIVRKTRHAGSAA